MECGGLRRPQRKKDRLCRWFWLQGFQQGGSDEAAVADGFPPASSGVVVGGGVDLTSTGQRVQHHGMLGKPGHAIGGQAKRLQFFLVLLGITSAVLVLQPLEIHRIRVGQRFVQVAADFEGPPHGFKGLQPARGRSEASDGHKHKRQMPPAQKNIEQRIDRS